MPEDGLHGGGEAPTPERECDVIMKGGIASGVVYPHAICAIARRFRLRSVGGTSAGAIAAACAAAAEYGRGVPGGGFERLRRLPQLLTRRTESGRSLLLSLFQAEPRSRGLLALLLAGTGEAGPARKIPRLVGVALLASRWRALIGALPGLLAALLVASRGAVDLALAAGACVLAALTSWLALTCRRSASRSCLAATTVLVLVLTPWVASRTAGADAVLVALGEAGLIALVMGALLGSLRTQVEVLLRDLPGQMFGLCSGRTGPGARTPALTDWLHREIQTLAGAERVLRFADLRARDIDLQVVTTCLTHGRPRVLPGSGRRFWFCPEEFRRLFPGDVVRCLEDEARRIRARDSGAPERDLEHAMMLPRLPFPNDDALPVLVAVRMSMAFPLLLAAVPLWDFDRNARPDSAIDNPALRRRWLDWARTNPEAWKRLLENPRNPPEDAPEPLRPERVWFSDGGISSNFPIHLFDAPLPRRPTIGINLHYHERGAEISEADRVTLAATSSDPQREEWTRIAPAGSRSPGTVAGFLGSVFEAMQNWTDTSLRRGPGYRDRFASIHLRADEGGLNLAMPEDVVERLSAFGARAGEKLGARFGDVEGDPADSGWTRHRWARLRGTLAALEDWLEGFRAGLLSDEPPTYLELVRRGPDEPPRGFTLEAEQIPTVEEALEALLALVEGLPEDDARRLTRGAPEPRGELRIQPRLRKPH